MDATKGAMLASDVSHIIASLLLQDLVQKSALTLRLWTLSDL